ncbi:hypothetical protein GWI33_020310 [Rhynchophorus ferrugineus]|uniref:Uncharacterized protein n=1 Tax=Rhynchophorus ferrugineus TaxID=354439 RepID=A0A834I3H1_RHYFE|nr:hypothetical protein GWI33_020310 [Rhynchophorus ferrugineus]
MRVCATKYLLKDDIDFQVVCWTLPLPPFLLAVPQQFRPQMDNTERIPTDLFGTTSFKIALKSLTTYPY